MRSSVVLIFLEALLVFCISTAVAEAGSSFTQSDRDRMIRLEEGQKATNKKIDDGLKATNQRIDDMKELIYVVISGMFILIGFILWDRRTALAPAVRKT